MREAFRLYFRYIGVSIRSQMQYRASFLMLSAGHFVATGIEFLGIWVLFDRFRSLGEWSLREVALFYGIVNIAFAIAEAVVRGFDTFSWMVKSGEFDRLLLRPRSTVLQLAGQELQLMRVGRLLQGVFVLFWAASALEVVWSAAKLALVFASVVGGACLFGGLFVLQATLAFWTTETLEIVNTVTYGGVETAQYPLTIYRRWFRRFFTFLVPLASFTYLPALAILDRTSAYGVPAFVAWAAPTVGVLFLVVSFQVWKIGVRHYRSTGS